MKIRKDGVLETQPVGVVDPGTLALEATLGLAKGTLSGRFDPITPVTQTLTASGDTSIVSAPSSPQYLRTVWLYAQAGEALGTSAVVVTIKRGSTPLYVVELVGSQPWMHGSVIDFAVGEDLVVNLSTAATVYFNADYRVGG